MASVVADASVPIAPGRIDRLSLLRDLMGEVVVPPAVALEVQATLPKLPDWIRVQSLLRGVESHAPWPRALGVGEIEAIALAIDLDAELVILDDLPARRFAIDRGFSVVGSAGLLLVANARGLVPSVRQDLDALGCLEGIRLSPQVRCLRRGLARGGRITRRVNSQRLEVRPRGLAVAAQEIPSHSWAYHVSFEGPLRNAAHSSRPLEV